MRSAFCLLAVLLLAARPAAAAKKPVVPELSQEHVHPSGAFSFRTPQNWTLEPVAANKEALDATSDAGLRVRFVYHVGDAGYDSLHVACMLERLAGPMDMRPSVNYEYDFLSGKVGEWRALDSAFVVIYDHPVQGYAEWHQRNLTLVGGDDSLCLVGYAPMPIWKKKDSGAREILDAILGSVVMHPAAQ